MIQRRYAVAVGTDSLLSRVAIFSTSRSASFSCLRLLSRSVTASSSPNASPSGAAFVGRDLVVLGACRGAEVDVIDEGARRLLEQLIVLLLEPLEADAFLGVWVERLVGISRSATRPRSEVVMADRTGTGGIGLTLGGAVVIAGILIAIFWSVIVGVIVALVGLLAFGGFARGRWY